MIAKLRALANRTPLGWLQLRHNRTRFIIALAGITFADLLMFMQLGVLAAALDSSALFHNQVQADIVLVSPEARDIANSGTIPRARVFQALEVPGVVEASPLYVGFLDWRTPLTGERKTMMVVGMDPNRPALDLPALTTRQSELKLPDTVLFDRLARGNFTAMLAVLDQGKPVKAEINRRTVTVTSSFSLGATFNTDGTLIGNETTFLHLFPNRDSGSVTFGLVNIAPTADRQRVVADLKRKFPDDVNVLTREEFIQNARDFQLRYTPIGFIFGLGTVMGFLVGLVMVYQILSSDVADHMSEYATFKAMGYTDLYLLGIIIEESLILACLGFIPGLISGFGIMRLIHAGTALPVSFPMTRIAGVFLLTLGMCIVSGFIAARRIRQADPAEIFS